MSLFPEAKSFMAYYRNDGEYEDDPCVEGTEFSCLGEDLASFFNRCITTLSYNLLIIYTVSTYNLTEVLRIE